MPFYIAVQKSPEVEDVEIPTLVLNAVGTEDGNHTQVDVVAYRYIDDAESIGLDVDDPVFLPLGELSQKIDFDTAYMAELVYSQKRESEKGMMIDFSVYTCGASKYLVVGNDSANPQLFIEDDAPNAFNRLSHLQDTMV